MKSALLIIAVVLSGMPLCLSQTITRQDLLKTVQHIQILAKEQKGQLDRARVDLVQVSKEAEKLVVENQHLRAKATEALKRFLFLYALIAGLLVVIFRNPIINCLKGFLAIAKPL